MAYSSSRSHKRRLLAATRWLASEGSSGFPLEEGHFATHQVEDG